MDKKFLIGIDAGGSNTRVLLGEVAQDQMRIVGSSAGPAGNPRSVGFDSAFEIIRHTVAQAFRNAGSTQVPASHACLSVAGAGRLEEQQRIFDWCRETGLAQSPVIVGDAECLLATVAQYGVALIAGTGSMAWGRNAAGNVARAGGQGYLFDDEGSGYWLAAQTLRRVCMAIDARAAPTSLLSAVLDHLNLASPDQLIGWCYESSDPRRQIASLAPVLFQQYPHDAAAQEIVHAGAQSLAQLVAAVTRQIEFSADQFTLACAGSVLLRQPVYQALLAKELDHMGVAPTSVCPIEEPVRGALELAWTAMRDAAN
ncbi:N-acetylglucosamine kinase [Allorhodopirellula heiligendammensis]|uniref:Glucosamine kinase GspK n=1 Tax=Allorhodopirellula heiligendammensis TaxID=2714739 RepID=A0A5C6BEW5_9BACT|nr:BadF/BadG/BcrA/BcrD ATPase family protein [Allorhodopirellula heiligendammensis]TWU10197.1 Glucosamine kinase GspK [Allorhodopirellula heiligendammensis]